MNRVILSPEYFPSPTIGRPISNAQIFVGIVDLDPEVLGNQKQISVQQEDGSVVQVSQPVLTGAGGVPIYNGSPVTILVDGNYSLKVLNRIGSQNYYIPSQNAEFFEASDSVYRGTLTVEDALDTTYAFDTVAAMVAATWLVVGIRVRTLGYATIGDSGGNSYQIVAAATGTDDGGSFIDLDTHQAKGLFPLGNILAMQFGCIGDGSVSTADMFTAATALWTYALDAQKSFMFSDGSYQIGNSNFPWRQSSVSALLDCNNIALIAESPATIFSTISPVGADVFQLNGLKNFHVKGFPTLTATLSDTLGAGSNGCSITNGFDNITLEIVCRDLPSIDQTTFIDGGKALTIQTPGVSEAQEVGSLSAKVFAFGCAEGFGYEPDLPASTVKKTAINIDIVAEDCFTAVKFSAGASAGSLSAEMTNGLVVKGQAINCQKDVVLGRCHGAEVDIQIVTTKTAAARRLDPNAVNWFAADDIVLALAAEYAHNSQINITGDKGACDFKAKIGGATAGSSTLTGATTNSRFFLDIGGTAGTADLSAVDSGGNTMVLSELVITSRTADDIPSIFYTASYQNCLKIIGDFGGSFTGTLTGCTTSPTATFEYSINGDIVVMENPILVGTSNSAFSTVTGVPLDIIPSARQTCIGVTRDNGVTGISVMVVETDGTITLGWLASSSGPFTAAGEKGTWPATITYRKT